MNRNKTIGLVAPGSSVTPGALRLSVKALRELGFGVKVGGHALRGANLFASAADMSVPSDDKARADELMRMFEDEEIDGIMALRGGYGCGRILEYVDYELVARNKKPLFGYSDITALHITLNQRAGLETYHTPMPATEFARGTDDYTMLQLMRCLREKRPFGIIGNPPNVQLKTLTSGRCEGVVTGGNLCTIVSLLGTPYEIDTAGKILFLEDVDEPPYKIDRMLLQMRLAGKLEACAGFLLGAFTEKGGSLGERLTAKIFTNHLARFNKPTIFGFSCGHILPTASLPLGRFMHMNADNGIIEVD